MGSCGHIMAVFDTHQKCAYCQEKGTGSDPCMLGQEDCSACALLTADQDWLTSTRILSHKGCRGIVFTHGVRMGGWAGRRREKVCPGCISVTVRCRKLILGRDIGKEV